MFRIIIATILLPNILSAKTITVAVLDTGIDKTSVSKLCKFGHKSFIKQTDALVDNHGHGTHIAGIIEQNAGNVDYCIVSIKWYDPKFPDSDNLVRLQRSIQYATAINVDFINISGGGTEYSQAEANLIKKALNKGIKVVASAGNERHDMSDGCNYFPACYDKRIVVVGSLNKTPTTKRKLEYVHIRPKMVTYQILDRAAHSNYGTPITRWEVGTDVWSSLPSQSHGFMSGTSQAAAVATGKLVKERAR